VAISQHLAEKLASNAEGLMVGIHEELREIGHRATFENGGEAHDRAVVASDEHVAACEFMLEEAQFG